MDLEDFIDQGLTVDMKSAKTEDKNDDLFVISTSLELAWRFRVRAKSWKEAAMRNIEEEINPAIGTNS